MTSYQLAYDQDIADELRKRLASEIAILEDEGFGPFSLHQEITSPFSVLIFFPAFLLMIGGRELIRIHFPLRITSFHLIYTSQPRATYAYIYGLGCKFYTNFTDGTWLVSNTNLEIKDKTVIAFKHDPESNSTRQIWKRHREKISELEAQGKRLNDYLSFDTWVKVDQQLDKASQPLVIGMGVAWLALVAWALYQLVSRLLPILGQ